jgi:hypothetical protein
MLVLRSSSITTVIGWISLAKIVSCPPAVASACAAVDYNLGSNRSGEGFSDFKPDRSNVVNGLGTVLGPDFAVLGAV